MEGDIGIFEACTELEQLFVNETKVRFSKSLENNKHKQNASWIDCQFYASESALLPYSIVVAVQRGWPSFDVLSFEILYWLQVDCDNIGKLKHELKGCEIKGNPSLVEAWNFICGVLYFTPRLHLALHIQLIIYWFIPMNNFLNFHAFASRISNLIFLFSSSTVNCCEIHQRFFAKAAISASSQNIFNILTAKKETCLYLISK